MYLLGHRFARTFLFCFSVFALTPCLGQNYLRYTNYTQSNGLSDNYINCINQDSRGFIWIGTWSGLNRFDGFNFKQYLSNKTKPDGMQGNWIFKIYEDSQKNLWVCTNNELMRYDWFSDQFKKVTGIDTMAIYDVVQDRNNILWITTEAGLIKYNAIENKIIKRFSKNGNKPDFPTNKLTDVVIDKFDNLWIGSLTDGLIYFNTKTNKTITYEIQSKDKNTPVFYNIRSLVFDKQGCLWMIGKYNNGIALFDTTSKTFSTKKHDPNNANTIPNDAVSRISCDKQGIIWICCQNECLSRYDGKTGYFHRYSRDPFIPTSLNAQSVSCLFTDNIDNTWIGSHGNGIYYLNKQKNRFKSYSMLSIKGLTLPGNIISSFAEMSDGKIIVGVDGGGLCEFDRKLESFKTYNTSNGLLSNAITKLLCVKNDIVWITSWNGGLDKYNYKTKSFEHFKNIPTDKFSLIHNNLKDVYPYDDDKLWIVTHGQGISMMDTKTNKFISHLSGVKTPFDFNIPVWGNSIIKDSKSRWWISSTSSLYMFDGKTYTSYNSNKLNQRKRSSNLVFMTYEDYQGTIWIVTDKAIDFYNEQTKNCETYDKLAGMPHNPKAIIEDLHHNLWISSNEGLSCIDAERKHIKRYSISDGLPSNDFVFRSVYRLKDGTLMFGGTFGFLLFNPDSLLENEQKPFVVLNEMYVNHINQIPGANKSLLNKALQSSDTICYTYNHDVISFDVSGIDFSNPDKISYSYKIKGLNDTWVAIGNERQITIPSLEPGKYTLQIKASKSERSFSINEKGLLIIVLPPWWKTIWFKCLLILLFIGLIFIIIHYRLKSVEKEKQTLEKLVESKTQSLRTALDNLHEAKQVIEIKNAELVESIELKDKLIGIIAHDFKSPLNAMTGMLRLIKLQTKSISKDKLDEYINTLSESAQKLENKMVMMTDWAQSHFKKMTYNPVDINLEILLNDAIILVRENARQKNISVSTQLEYVHNAFIDARMIHTVFMNLLSNAIKFTPENGAVIVVFQENSNGIEISFIDTGVGLEDERIESFMSGSDSFKNTYGTKGEKGFGFGLQICKQFVEKNKGKISVKSEVGKGSVFIVDLPMSQSIADSKITTIDSKQTSETTELESFDVPKQYSILIIDDNEELVNMLQAVFEQNFDVLKAFDGKSGLHIARNMIPDIIISDINLPGMTGFEVCRELKNDSLTGHIPVVIISGENIAGLEMESYSYGANDFLSKPFNALNLKTKILVLLGNINNNKTNKNKPSILFELPESADDLIIKKIIEILHKNIGNAECDIDVISSDLALSRTQLWRKTKSILGKTPSELLRDLRLQKAAEMLKSGKYRVSDIAYNVGFSDPRYFSRSFTKAFGMSPTDYLEKNSTL